MIQFIRLIISVHLPLFLENSHQIWSLDIIPNPLLKLNDPTHQSYLQHIFHIPRNQLSLLGIMISHMHSKYYCSSNTKFWHSVIIHLLTHCRTSTSVAILSLTRYWYLVNTKFILSVAWLTLESLNMNFIVPWYFTLFLGHVLHMWSILTCNINTWTLLFINMI